MKLEGWSIKRKVAYMAIVYYGVQSTCKIPGIMKVPELKYFVKSAEKLLNLYGKIDAKSLAFKTEDALYAFGKLIVSFTNDQERYAKYDALKDISMDAWLLMGAEEYLQSLDETQFDDFFKTIYKNRKWDEKAINLKNAVVIAQKIFADQGIEEDAQKIIEELDSKIGDKPLEEAITEIAKTIKKEEITFSCEPMPEEWKDRKIRTLTKIPRTDYPTTVPEKYYYTKLRELFQRPAIKDEDDLIGVLSAMDKWVYQAEEFIEDEKEQYKVYYILDALLWESLWAIKTGILNETSKSEGKHHDWLCWVLRNTVGFMTFAKWAFTEDEKALIHKNYLQFSIDPEITPLIDLKPLIE